MANQVYANGREISCKAAAGKSICAFPDVCFTPPLTPATPPGVPIPYPNTGMSSDTSGGSKTVKISGKEVMLKDSSYFSTSTGDEAGCAPKKGVLTSKIKGKVYFTSWSMDVKIEGENAVRHLDLTTHNHASMPPQTPPWMHVDEMAIAAQQACQDEIDKAEEACQGSTGPSDCSPACYEAQKCLLVPKGNDKARCCEPATTGHHMIEDHWVQGNANFPTAQGSSGNRAAPCVCVEGSRFDGEHGIMHAVQGVHEDSFLPGGANAGRNFNYERGKATAIRAHKTAFPNSNCSDECLEAQMDAFYGNNDAAPLNQPTSQQAVAQTPAEGRLLRNEAESVVDMVFGGPRL